MEKRTAPRFKIPLKLEYAKPASPTRYSSLLVDINFKGLRVKSQQPLKEEEVLDLFFYFPNKPVQEAVGKVVWSKNFSSDCEAGLYFLNLRDSLKESIFEYIFKYFPRQIQEQWWRGFNH